MTQQKDGVTINGIPLSRFGSIINQFDIHAGLKGRNASQIDAQLDTPITKDVKHFSQKLAMAMRQHLGGFASEAESAFADALEERSSLMSNPKVKQNPELLSYVTNVVATAPDGDIGRSLDRTCYLHSKAGDPNYRGESPQEKSAPVPHS